MRGRRSDSFQDAAPFFMGIENEQRILNFDAIETAFIDGSPAAECRFGKILLFCSR